MKYRILSVFLLLAVGLAVSGQYLRAEENLIERFDFVEADLRDILRSIGMAGKITVLLTKEVSGTYTLYIRQPMAVREALERIARTYEYDVRWLNPEKTVVVIGKTETLKQNFDINMLQTRVFTLRYSSVAEIAEALKVVVDQAKMSLNPRTNQIVITGSLLQLENAAEIIAQMDHPMPQVNIEARMEEILESSMEELGLVWGGTYSLTFGPGFSILPAEVLSAKLNVLHTQNKAVTLAQPNATCLDSQQATIFIGDKYPVARLQIVEGKEIWTVEYAEIGTKLVIKPRVNKENIVTVSVKAEVSSILEYVDLSQAGKYPLIRTRSTESLARLKDGQTFVLTGLVQRDDKTEQTGIPLLDRLPILSALFKNKKTEKRSTVICLFLTPRIQPVTEDELAGGTARAAAPAPTAPGSAGEGKKDQAGPSKEKEAQGPGGVTPAPAAPTPPPPSTSTTSTPKTEGTAAPVSPAPSAPETAETESQDAASAPQPQAPAEAAPAPQEGLETPPATPPAEAAEGGTTPATPSGVVEETALPAVETATPSTPPSPAEAPAPAEAVGPVEPQPPAAGPAVPMRPEDLKEVAYTVKKGDTLFSIAKKFGVEAKKIADYNKLKSSSKLYLGQVLRIPIPDSHKYVVKPKETLWRIAKRYGVSVELLAEINGLADPTKLEVGQVIVLPCPVDRVVNPGF